MNNLEKYFLQLKLWEQTQENIETWEQFTPTIENVEEFAHKTLNLDPDTRDKSGALTYENILASSCSSISDFYRYKQSTEHLKNIEDMMQKYKTNAPIVLFRGVSDVPFEKMEQEAKELDEIDTDFYELGYMSCSLIKEKASPYKTQLIIYCPPFSNIIYCGHCNDQEEPECRYECIISRGSKLKILKQENNTFYCILKNNFTSKI